MSDCKWTPGPWKHALRNANEIMTTFHGVQIGRIYIDVTTDNEAEDAHLIAAAPELADAIKWALAVFGPDTPEHAAILEAMHAALAKARGEAT
jgi:hypothetical protein